TENSRAWPLLIGVDGTVTPRPHSKEAPVPAQPAAEPTHDQGEVDATRPRPVGSPPTPSGEQPAPTPIISAVPGAQEETESAHPTTAAHDHVTANAPEDVVPPQPQGAEQRPMLDEASRVHPTPEPPDMVASTSLADASDPVNADSRWTDISQQPATQGFRGTLNGMGLKLSPTDDELAQRREALRQEIAREEEARRADE